MLRYEWLNNVMGDEDSLVYDLCGWRDMAHIVFCGGGWMDGVECWKFVAKLYLFMIENMVHIFLF